MESYKDIYNNHLLPHLGYLTTKVYQEKSELKLSNVTAFNDKAQFLEGKIINGLSYCLIHSPNKEHFDHITPDLFSYLAESEYETWGILNALFGLLRLKEHNLLDKYLTSELRNTLNEKLHYRTFLREDNLTLIDKPTNYYGVAFGIASIRILLGFDETNLVDAIFDKLLTHIEVHSNGSDYMDETNGDGRFDRYTLLIPAELLNLCILSNRPAPKKLLDMLRKSCEIFLSLANDNGDGFSYGRSIGTYGDTSALEILSMGCYLDILSPAEKQLAYLYALNIANKFKNTWYDEETQSINMWFKGRGTDEYRNKNRILGENYSLYLQIIHSFEYLHRSNIDLDNINQLTLSSLKEKISASHEYVFNESTYKQKLYLFNILDRTCTLPFINGANKYYYSTPYLPIPNLQRVFESTADSYHPNLIPIFTLDDGTQVMPISYFNEIKCIKSDGTMIVTALLDQLCIIGGENPAPFQNGSGTITYTISLAGLRVDFTFDIPNLKDIYMEFASFNSILSSSDSDIIFSGDYIKSIAFNHFDTVCTSVIGEDNSDYHTPNGPLHTLIKCSVSTPTTHSVGYEIKFNI